MTAAVNPVSEYRIGVLDQQPMGPLFTDIFYIVEENNNISEACACNRSYLRHLNKNL